MTAPIEVVQVGTHFIASYDLGILCTVLLIDKTQISACDAKVDEHG